MFKIESYVTPILLSYVDKYVRDFKPADAQLSLWSGGVVLHNLVLKTDVLQDEVSLPFTLISGRIHELIIRVPWTKIISEPITVTIDTIECILSLRNEGDTSKSSVGTSDKTQVVETPPGYMQALVRRIVSNIAIRVQHLIVKYVQDDIVLSLNVKHLSIDSTGADWVPSFADIDQNKPEIRRTVLLDDLTLCLDKSDSDGKIRFYQDPLLYRCRLDFRVLTRLVSANNRKASSINIEMTSSKLAWGVTNEQLVLLLRLCRESPVQPAKLTPTGKEKPQKSTATASPTKAEPERQGSWTEWAWSWMPTLIDREPGPDELPVTPHPIPMSVAAYIDDISLILKVLETEGSARKRSRAVLEVYASHAAVRSTICVPTLYQIKIGIRTLIMQSQGKCVCGHIDMNSAYDEPTVYFKRKENPNAASQDWEWPNDKENLPEGEIEKAEIATEHPQAATPSTTAKTNEELSEVDVRKKFQTRTPELRNLEDLDIVNTPMNEIKEDVGYLWQKMSPILFISYAKERSPPNAYTNPYENPPLTFEYSDWVEDCVTDIQIKPVDIQICMGLIHRLQVFLDSWQEGPDPQIDLTKRTLTVEENEALMENLPQQRFNIQITDLNVHVLPWDHSLTERPVKPPLILTITLPKVNFIITAPLYPLRVCAAASQIPKDQGPLWQGARIHITAALHALQASITSHDGHSKPCARMDLRVVTHKLQHPHYFDQKRSVIYSYAAKIREMNIAGSAARLHSVIELLTSLKYERISQQLYYSSLTKDAFYDEDSVAFDITLEDWIQRGFITKDTTTHHLTLKSLRATVFHSPENPPVNDEVKQAWVVSGPETPTTTPFLRLAIQLCDENCPNRMNYFGIWAEPAAFAVDPLFIAWLSYKPTPKLIDVSCASLPSLQKFTPAAHYFQQRRRLTPTKMHSSMSQTQSGKSKSQSAEVHSKTRSRSLDSSSEPSERQTRSKPVLQPKQVKKEWFKGPGLLKLYERLKTMKISVELGLMLVYFTTKTASAVDFPSIRTAMEQHASDDQSVVVLSLGRWTMYTSSLKKNIWHSMNHDGPTYATENEKMDSSFPWKLALADISCYTLEATYSPGLGSKLNPESSRRSKLKVQHIVNPRTVLELVTTTVILSVVTKTQQQKIIGAKPEKPSVPVKPTNEDLKMKYFREGIDFKPTTLKEFFRGPKSREKANPPKSPTRVEKATTQAQKSLKQVVKEGPVISLGFNLHADTPPIKVSIEHDQVQLIAATLHCFQHLIAILNQHPLVLCHHRESSMPRVASIKSERSRNVVGEMEEVASTSDNSSSSEDAGITTIYEKMKAKNDPGEIKAFLLFQWVISRATLVITAQEVKLAFDVDDIITTVDLQEHYNQMKTKIVSASIRQFKRDHDSWTAGPLAGRILEARESTNVKENSHFISITVTQALIANLPVTWKEELHPKIFEERAPTDSIWEVYATLAPLDVLILPNMVENMMTVANAVSPNSYCTLPSEKIGYSSRDLPYCFINTGGLKLIVGCDVPSSAISKTDDTFVLLIGKISANPHPNNPIIRRPISGKESSVARFGGYVEGRQYELMIEKVAIKSTRFSQLVIEEGHAQSKKSVRNNPAHTWNQTFDKPIYTPVLHPMDVNIVLAPALFASGMLLCGGGLEFSIMTDCTVELSMDQLQMTRILQQHIRMALLSAQQAASEAELNEDICPYAPYIKVYHGVEEVNRDIPETPTVLAEEDAAKPAAAHVPDAGGANASTFTVDSGVDTATSRSTLKSAQRITSMKKSVMVQEHVQTLSASEHYEVIITMGTIEVSLYTMNDESDAIKTMFPKQSSTESSMKQDNTEKQDKTSEQSKKKSATRSDWSSNSVTENVRDDGVITTYSELQRRAISNKTSTPLLHIQMIQPNLYYWRKKIQKSLQVSIFNVWLGFGTGPASGYWHTPLISTARGDPDPLTDIPPALATMVYGTTVNGSTISSYGPAQSKLQIDVERPVKLEISEDNLKRLLEIRYLLMTKLGMFRASNEHSAVPALYHLRRALKQLSCITVATNQISVSGSEGSCGWESMSMQLNWTPRPDRLIMRWMFHSIQIVLGPATERRLQLLQPVRIGVILQATWNPWRQSEGGWSMFQPHVRLNLDLTRVAILFRPIHLDIITDMYKIVRKIFVSEKFRAHVSDERVLSSENISLERSSTEENIKSSISSQGSFTYDDLYYKDDLKSGAFKILSGGQLPMAYQIRIYRSEVTWKYPHPRAITRIVAFPLPNHNKEIKTVLEFYNQILDAWEPHTYVTLPTVDPIEINLDFEPPDVIFATTWRYRVVGGKVEHHFKGFDLTRFVPRSESFSQDIKKDIKRPPIIVSAEELLGVLRVDSYLSPRSCPRVEIVLRSLELALHLYNTQSCLTSRSTSLEGLYLSKPHIRQHRVLSLCTSNSTVHARLGPAGRLFVANAQLSSLIMDSATGAMEQLVNHFDIQVALSLPSENPMRERLRLCTSIIHIALHAPRLRTLESLFEDWKYSLDEFLYNIISPKRSTLMQISGKHELENMAAGLLDGRVFLWIHNMCSSALRVGQQDTDEVVPLGPGVKLAYRWRNPNMPKSLRFALAAPSTEWHWSHSVPFVEGSRRVRLDESESTAEQQSGAGKYLYIRVQELSQRQMDISGRLVLANMLRLDVEYKVRALMAHNNAWATLCTGDLSGESIGRSVICPNGCDMVLKLKFVNHDTGWSGDIPLRECPKENVPWLVKIPSEGDIPYISVWCRVVRARTDNRILASLWPLYILHSHLTLDTDVLVATDLGAPADAGEGGRLPPLIQTAPGRGACTHLLAPGTTAAKHTLSFQYRNIECPVTRDAVPLHYGVTNTSVFEKFTPIYDVDEALKTITAWLKKSGRTSHFTSSWPYSMVTKHMATPWQSALLQPRCEVSIRYRPVRTIGGCSLEVHLSPVLMLCNASPIALTLRAHDAAPLCKLEPGKVISPPSVILQKPFFVSLEMGRDTFVSAQLEIFSKDPGRYGSPPAGQVAIDHPSMFAIQCGQKVALLNLYYEIKEEINVLGLTSSFVLLNWLNREILICATAVPRSYKDRVCLRPKYFKTISPSHPESTHGTPLTRFWLRDRWRGGDAAELLTFLSVALPAVADDGPTAPAAPPVPVRLGMPNTRRAFGLIDRTRKSIPVVVTQHNYDGQWVVCISKDPCPQFIVKNNTVHIVAIGQPMQTTTEHQLEHNVVLECPGAYWNCIVEPDDVVHYTLPGDCVRHPPSPEQPLPDPLITFTIIEDDKSYPTEWCQPVAVTNGEQLLQLNTLTTVKLRIHTYSHSTYIELLDVHMNDISASNIRKRLADPEEFKDIELEKKHTDSCVLNRTKSDDNIFLQNITSLTDQIPREQSLVKSVNKSTAGSRVTFPIEDDIIITSKHDFDVSPSKHDFDVSPSKHDFDVGTSKHDFEDSILKDEPRNLGDECSVRHVINPRKSSYSSCHSINTADELEYNTYLQSEKVLCKIAGLILEVATAYDAKPLLALHVDRVSLFLSASIEKIHTKISIAGFQIDNMLYENGQYDFAVIATTGAEPQDVEQWPTIWNMFNKHDPLFSHQGSENARAVIKLCHDRWSVANKQYTELTEVEISAGPIALYIEDAYIKSVYELFRLLVPPRESTEETALLAEIRSTQKPLRLRLLYIYPLDLTLTLHTAVRMYIALDQSPLHLSAFTLQNMFTSPERLTHALTVHYLSATMLGAGWVVGGLELLGAPGALAARVGGATGGVKGIASATAAALLRSLSAWAGSLARNLDLLAGDEEHARRAAAARRRPPDSFMGGLLAGITNFAINMLGAVGGLAHHPLVGVAVGESGSSATALRRGLLGALTKPLSATADLVAYAGNGLLKQTGWDPVPKPRGINIMESLPAGWRRNCVRWAFLLADLKPILGFEVMLDNMNLQLLFTDKFLVFAELDTERILEMIDFRYCKLGKYEGTVIELIVSQKKSTKNRQTRILDDDEYQINVDAMDRVARYTGSDSSLVQENRVLALLPVSRMQSQGLHNALTVAINRNSPSYFRLT